MTVTIVHVAVSGRVQGVGYRRWAAGEAIRWGLAGWVRNRIDGTVEAVVAGDAEAVDAFLAACRAGPRGASVAGVAVMPHDGPAPEGFRVLPTA